MEELHGSFPCGVGVLGVEVSESLGVHERVLGIVAMEFVRFARFLQAALEELEAEQQQEEKRKAGR